MLLNVQRTAGCLLLALLGTACTVSAQEPVAAEREGASAARAPAGPAVGVHTQMGAELIGADRAVVLPSGEPIELGAPVAAGPLDAAALAAVDPSESCAPRSTPAPAAPATSGWREMRFETQEWANVARDGHTAIWDGAEMIVFGGAVAASAAGTIEAARYTPSTDTWTQMPASSLTPRAHHVAAWTGHAMLVWGGETTDATHAHLADGAIYDPCSNSWRPMTEAPIRWRAGSSAVWADTTRELLVFGGARPDGAYSSAGYAFHPATNSWRRLADAPIAGRARHGAAFTAGQMVVFGGVLDGDAPTATAATYDPKADAWTAIADAPSTIGARAPTSELPAERGATFWGGATGKRTFDGTFTGYAHMDGATYDPTSRVWSVIAAPPAEVIGERVGAATWTANGKLFVFGGHVFDADHYIHTASDGAVYDSSRSEWTKLDRPGIYAMREGATAVWTGAEAIVVGGRASCSMCDPNPRGGEVFRP